jgi:hypothetical protein
MAKKEIIRTGEKVKTSGQYKASGTDKEVTLVKGKKTPPNVYGGLNKFTLVDKTKHKKNK